MGTLATVIPIARVKAVIIWNPIKIPTTKTIIPIAIAKIPNLNTNLSIYFYKGVGSSYDPTANPAIWPIKVLSPVNITNPIPLPYLFKVEKNAIFFVSKALSGRVH